MLVVGLGGGSLPLFVHDYFPQAHVAVVEIDPSMLEVATRWFGFSQDDRMQVHIADGLDHVDKLAAEGTILQSFNSTSCPALLLVSSSVSSLPVLSCPSTVAMLWDGVPHVSLASPAMCHKLQP